MKICKLPDGSIEVRDLRSATIAPGDLGGLVEDKTWPLGALTMSRAEFSRLIDLGCNLELAAPECIFIEG